MCVCPNQKAYPLNIRGFYRLPSIGYLWEGDPFSEADWCDMRPCPLTHVDSMEITNDPRFFQEESRVQQIRQCAWPLWPEWLFCMTTVAWRTT